MKITVQENPYRLADDVWGIGFKTADQIAGKLGIIEAYRMAGYKIMLAAPTGRCAPEAYPPFFKPQT